MSNNLSKIIEKFGNDYSTTNGEEIRFNCPFCERRRGKADKGKKLYVNTKSLWFYCFKCGAKGKVSKSEAAHGVYEQILNMKSSMEHLESEDDENMFYVPNLKITPDSVAYEYCIKRGIDEDKIKFYNIRLGVDELFGRIVIPNEIYGSGNWTDMFSARSYIGQTPKYFNPSGAKKTNSVFNLHNIKEGCDDLIVVEGAITAICAGRDAVAVYGCHPSDQQLKSIIDKNPKRIYCVLDNDAAGHDPNEQLSEIFRSQLRDSEVYLVWMPEGIDAADMGENLFKKYVEKNKILCQGKVYVRLMSCMKG